MDRNAINSSTTAQERIKFDDPLIEKLYEYLSKKSESAYQDQLLLSNEVFGKSYLSISILNKYLEGKESISSPFLFCLKKLTHYFLKSLGWLFIFSMQNLAHLFSGQKFTVKTMGSITLIDVFLVPEQIVENGDICDRFFPGLEAKLKSIGTSYAYAPKFVGDKNPMLYYKMFRQMKLKNRSVLSSFQFLTFFDYLKMFMFIFVYPIRVFRQIGKLGSSREDSFLRLFLWDSMSHVSVKNYERQLFGKHISKLKINSIKCISWYENQPQDKNFYRGLRFNQSEVKVYGAQLFPWSSTILNYHIHKGDHNLRLIPDCILVNGPYFLQDDRGTGPNIKVGPSMRYSKLFNTQVNPKNKTAILIAMPFFEYEIEAILKILNKLDLSVELFIKLHPGSNIKKYSRRIQGKMKLVEGDIYTFFEQVGCVIGMSTGALVEATSLGIPAINIEIKGLNHKYLPELGKGIIWENVSNEVELRKWLKNFSNLLQTKPDLIRSIAERHKKMFFCEPTDTLIEEAFGLNE